MLYDSYPEVVHAAAGLVSKKPGIWVHLPNGKPAFRWQRAQMVLAGHNASSDEQAVREVIDGWHAPGRLVGADGHPWGISYHTWVRYSDRTPLNGREYDQILSAPHMAPSGLDGFSRRELAGGWMLFFRPESSVFAMEYE
jgi:hypothetical protein